MTSHRDEKCSPQKRSLKIAPEFQATLERRWIEMEIGADKGISGASLMRKLRALASKK